MTAVKKKKTARKAKASGRKSTGGKTTKSTRSPSASAKTKGRKKAAPAKKKTGAKKAVAKKVPPKKAAKPPARKKAATGKATTSKAAASKATTKKAATAKAAKPVPVAVGKKLAAVPKPPGTAAGRAARPARKKRSATTRGRGAAPESLKRHPKFGLKFECFSCSAKFYDLNRPEPLCPKCGADQRERPKSDTKASQSPVSRRRARVRPMAPLLDDDDESSVTTTSEVGAGEIGRDRTPTSGDDFFDDATATPEGEDDE